MDSQQNIPLQPSQIPTSQPIQSPMPQQPSPTLPKHSLFHKYYFWILGLLLVVMISLPFLYFANQLSKNLKNVPATTPTPFLFTLQNAQSAISAIDQSIQTSLNTIQPKITAVSSTQLPDSKNASASAIAVKNIQQNFISTINLLTQTSESVDTLSKELSPLIESSSNSATLTSTFIDLNNKTTDIKSTLKADTALVGLIIPTSITKDKIIANILQDLARVVANFGDIRKDLTLIRTGLFAVPTLQTVPSSCTPRPDCLDAQPACKIAEPANGWCTVTPTITESPTLTPTVSPTVSPNISPTP